MAANPTSRKLSGACNPIIYLVTEPSGKGAYQEKKSQHLQPLANIIFPFLANHQCRYVHCLHMRKTALREFPFLTRATLQVYLARDWLFSFDQARVCRHGSAAAVALLLLMSPLLLSRSPTTRYVTRFLPLNLANSAFSPALSTMGVPIRHISNP